jgi:DNA-binding beta-propeller fold protein YncE
VRRKNLGHVVKRLIAAIVLAPSVAAAAPLELVQTIPLSVTGRIDHFSVDVPGKRLVVAALGNHTVEIIDLAAGKVARSLDGYRKPQGVAHSVALNRLFVADGDLGAVESLDAGTLRRTARTDGLSDADNLRYDASDDRLYAGYGDGAIRIFDAKTGATLADIKLPAHPEAFALAPKSRQLVVNVPDAGVVDVVDVERKRVAQTWRVEDARSNFALSIDEGAQRVFVAARRPPMVLIYELETGRRVASLPTCGDIDDLFYDRELSRLYAVCGEGQIDVIRRQDADHYVPEARIATRPGARTGLYVPELHRLYVAVPQRAGANAEIRVYSTQE